MNIPVGVNFFLLALAILIFVSGWVWDGAKARNIRTTVFFVLFAIVISHSVYQLFV